jgi:DNA-directed RNA polymerase specialized sigma24 family protein
MVNSRAGEHRIVRAGAYGRRLHPAVAELTPAQALDMVDSPELMHRWIARSGVEYSRGLVMELWNRAEGADEGPGPGDFRRTDAERLRTFVRDAARLPPRLRQIANLCLDHGLSLSQCAERLGIARETVRAHLRRLRLLERRSREHRH